MARREVREVRNWPLHSCFVANFVPLCPSFILQFSTFVPLIHSWKPLGIPKDLSLICFQSFHHFLQSFLMNFRKSPTHLQNRFNMNLRTLVRNTFANNKKYSEFFKKKYKNKLSPLFCIDIVT